MRVSLLCVSAQGSYNPLGHRRRFSFSAALPPIYQAEKRCVMKRSLFIALIGLFCFVVSYEAKAISSELLNTPFHEADSLSAEEQTIIGIRYLGGWGVPQSDEEAAKWFHKAAEQGNTDAQFNLGILYAVGQGVPQSDAEAVKWFRKAAEQGHAKAKGELDAIGGAGF